MFLSVDYTASGIESKFWSTTFREKRAINQWIPRDVSESVDKILSEI